MYLVRIIVAFSALIGGFLFYFGRGTFDLERMYFWEISGNHLAGAALALLGIWMAARREA
jgi:hypothetical protein